MHDRTKASSISNSATRLITYTTGQCGLLFNTIFSTLELSSYALPAFSLMKERCRIKNVYCFPSLQRTLLLYVQHSRILRVFCPIDLLLHLATEMNWNDNSPSHLVSLLIAHIAQHIRWKNLRISVSDKKLIIPNQSKYNLKYLFVVRPI